LAVALGLILPASISAVPAQASTPGGATVYEAEAATLSGGAAVASDHPGYTGTGFVTFQTQGSTSTFSVNAPSAGTYVATLRYSNGPNPKVETKTVSVLQGGAFVQQLSFPSTADWNTWSTQAVSLTLPAGTSTVAFKYGTADTGFINLDSLSIQGATVFEAEAATLSGGAAVGSDHPGFTGTGFVTFQAQGSTSTFTVNAPSAGTYAATLRYSNGPYPSVETKTLSVLQGGAFVQQVSFPSTADWNTWSTQTLSLTLPAGTSTVAFKRGTTDTGFVNLDSLSIPGAATVFETETATLSGGATVASDHPGFTGTGFVTFQAHGSTSTFAVNAPSAGTYTAALRYSNGPNPSVETKTLSLLQGGTFVKQISFPSTADWNTWSMQAVSLTLPAGTSAVSIADGSTDTGWVNLDSISIPGATVTLPVPTATVALGTALTRPMDHIGQGFLYGLSQDGSQPSDALLQPLLPNIFRGGGARIGGGGQGWIADGFTAGPNYQVRIDSSVAQARRVTAAPYNAEYVLVMSDLWGDDQTHESPNDQPCNPNPTTNVLDCSNWVTFVTTTVNDMINAGVTVTYEPFNEPEVSWNKGMNTPQYFAMWDSAVNTIRALAPGVQIEGPTSGSTAASTFETFLAHAKAAGTVPNVLSEHDLGTGTIVADAVVMRKALADNGITGVKLSMNEYLTGVYAGVNQLNPAGTISALSQFVASSFDTAARAIYPQQYSGQSPCCMAGDLGGIMVPDSSAPGGLVGSGQYWLYRSYADLGGSYVQATSSLSAIGAIASSDPTKRQAVILIGNEFGTTGPVSLTITGLAAQGWMNGSSQAQIVVKEIPDQAKVTGPTIQSTTTVGASNSITVNVTLSGKDALAIYVTPVG
jgi:uncharacterized protein YegP (UPF0339 family)